VAVTGQEGSMARKRYQRGWLIYDEKTGKAWGRWREDVIGPEGEVKRRQKKKYLGEFKTQRLALRELDKEIMQADINNPNYRPRRDSSFELFAKKWVAEVLSQHKASTQAGDRSRIKKHIVPYFAKYAVRDITAYEVQAFISKAAVGAKSKRNLVATLRMMHTTAKAWKLANCDWFESIVLPEWIRPEQPSFSLGQMRQIIGAAEEPFKTFYWITAETGCRLGEGCALRPCDINLESCTVTIRWSAWHGIVGSTKSKKPRAFSISQQLAEHLREFLRGMDLTAYIFHRKDGTAWVGDWDVVATHLRPLLRTLGIPAAGLHAFRHGNASLMDSMATPMKVRMERIGHADEEMTLQYSHAQSEDHKRVADKLGELLRPFAPSLLPDEESGEQAKGAKTLVIQ
jgi:integrase